MSRLIESIRLYNGSFARLELHQARVDRAAKALFNRKLDWQISDLLHAQAYPPTGLYKCRVLYDVSTVQVEFSAYQPKLISTLKLASADAFDYTHKYEDRTAIERALGLRDGCDDILMVKNGLITDTSYANIVFEKDGQWFTPESFLLPGTMRHYLLETKQIEQAAIAVDQLASYQRFKLINAMLEFDSPAQPIANIIL
jgi:4-amino-4-deoxychorismate lyase